MNRIEVLIQEWAGDADALAEIADRIERDVLPSSAYWGMWVRTLVPSRPRIAAVTPTPPATRGPRSRWRQGSAITV